MSFQVNALNNFNVQPLTQSNSQNVSFGQDASSSTGLFGQPAGLSLANQAQQQLLSLNPQGLSLGKSGSV